MAFWMTVIGLCIFFLFFDMRRQSLLFYRNGNVPCLNQKKSNNEFLLTKIYLVLLVLICGFRFEMGGSDYFVYQGVYLRLPNIFGYFGDFFSLEIMYNTFGHEKGWLFFMSVSKTIGINYNGFLLIHSMFFYFCIYKFLKRYSVNPMLTILVFLYTMFFYNSMVSLRQSTTIGIFLLILPYIQQKNYKKYFLGVLICLFIHKASLFLIIPYFIDKIKISKRFIFFLVFLSVYFLGLTILNINFLALLNPFIPIIKTFLGETVGEKIYSLINTESEGINLLHSMQYVLILFSCYYFYDEFTNKNMKFFITMIICLYPILIIFRNYSLLTRVKDYFYIFYGLILESICLIKKGKYIKIVIPITLVLCVFGFFRFIIAFDDGHFLYFKTIFSQMF